MEINNTVLVLFFIFFARVGDVSIRTVRIILITRGYKHIAPLIGFVEVIIWLFAISTALKHLNGFWSYIVYASGFAVGNYVGMLVEERLKLGYQSIRIITTKKAAGILQILREKGIGLTEVDGRDKNGEVSIIYTVVSRKSVKQVIDIVQQYHPKAFITIEDVKAHHEGFISQNSMMHSFTKFLNRNE